MRGWGILAMLSIVLALPSFGAESRSVVIRGLQLDLVDLRHAEFSDDWRQIKNRLEKHLNFTIGVEWNQSLEDDVKKSAAEFLIKRDFYSHEILKISLDKDTESAVLKIQLRLGERVFFGFQGNQRFSASELKELVNDHRALGLSKNYVTEIMDRLLDLYRSKGYANVKIYDQSVERPKEQSRYITYFINEGHRIRVSGIVFDGPTSFSQDILRKQYFHNAKLLVQRSIYVESEVQSAADQLVDWIKSQGFLSAKFNAINRKFSEDQRSVQLVIYLYEGEQTMVRDIDISGITQISKDQVNDFLKIEKNRPFNLFDFTTGLEKLKTEYRNMGYLQASITNEGSKGVVTYSRNNRFADIRLQIEEGYRYRLGKVQITGLSKTKREVVLRELELESGDVLESALITESEINIRKLGLFSSVRFQTRDVPGQAGIKDLRIVVSELEPGVISGGVGFRNDEGIRAFGELGYNNIWKRNHSGTFGAAVNKRVESVRENDSEFVEFEVELAYSYPWFVLPRMTFRPRFQFEKQKFIEFDTESFVFSSSFERQLFKNPNIFGSLTYSLENTRQFNAPASEDNETLTIGAIIPAVTLDLRDNPLAPTRGFFSRFSFEYASPNLGSESEVGYSKIEWRNDGFVPLAEDVTWFLSFRTGWSRNNIDPSSSSDPSSVGIPLIKQFALGGVRSLRGYRFQELNVFTQTTVRGTLTYVNYRSQLDLPLAGQMRFGPFVDAANLNVDRYTLGDLLYSAGFGIHYTTPVGPINFDWGFKLNPLPGTDKNRFHFSIGIL